MRETAEPELVLDGGGPFRNQIEGQIRRLILEGFLPPGEELPTVRALAVGLAINPHTVELAYRRLNAEGFLTQGEASGPRVAAPPAGPKDNVLEGLCRDFLRRTAGRGYSAAEILSALHHCLEEGVWS
jgi:GntR family transcriptional regulator